MLVKVKDKDKELKYTFNSFKHMQNFDISSFAELDRFPFKIISLASEMLFGALNHDRHDFVPYIVAEEIVESKIEDGTIDELIEHMSTLLEESNFFKSLQKTKQE